MKTARRKKIGTGLIVLLVTVCLIPSLAFAFTPNKDGRRGAGFDQMSRSRSSLGLWRNPQMVQELGLTEGQVKEIQAADFTFQEKRLALKTDLDKLRLEMDKAFSSDTVDDAAILKTAQKMADVEGKMFVQRIESRLALGKILTNDQMDKLKMSDVSLERKGPPRGKARISMRQ